MTFTFTVTRRFTVWRKPSNNYTSMLPRPLISQGVGCGEAKMFHGGDYTRNSKRNHPWADAPAIAAPPTAGATIESQLHDPSQYGDAAAMMMASSAAGGAPTSQTGPVVGATQATAAYATTALATHRRFGFTGDEEAEVPFCQPLPSAQSAYTAWFAETYIVPLLRARRGGAASDTTTATSSADGEGVAPVTDAERAAAVDYLLAYGAPSVSNASSPAATPAAVAAATEALAEAEANAMSSTSGVVTDASAAFERAKKRQTHRIFDVATAGVVADLVGSCNVDEVLAEVPVLQMRFHPDGLAGHAHGQTAASATDSSSEVASPSAQAEIDAAAAAATI